MVSLKIYCDRHTILINPKDGKLTQFGHMCNDLGINIIAACTPQAKGKVEKMNFTIQNRLLNDIKRFNIKSIDELNKFFNDFYCDYINRKYSYEPKESETSFVPLDNIDLSNILCIRDTRTMLNGNVISWNNHIFPKGSPFGVIYLFTIYLLSTFYHLCLYCKSV